MLEFAILMVFLLLAQRITIGKPYVHVIKPYDPYDNGTDEKYVLDHGWEFESVEDCFEFRELRKTGWKGNAEDFYRWRDEEDVD